MPRLCSWRGAEPERPSYRVSSGTLFEPAGYSLPGRACLGGAGYRFESAAGYSSWSAGRVQKPRPGVVRLGSRAFTKRDLSHA